MKILMRNQKNAKWKLAETATYNNEIELQNLLEESPELISISDLREGAGPLVLAVREFPLQIGSIDILAFNAEGDIVIVECKLAFNPEAKRKVIGQVLEYGANLWQMSYEDLDQGVQARHGEPLAELIRKAANEDWYEENFRNNIKESLENGNFIHIIVVDEINDELTRIVRYMNNSGSQGFSLAALEMRRFQYDGAELLIPRFYGPSQVISTKSAKRSSRQWDELSFFTEMQSGDNENAVRVAQTLLDWSKKNTRVWWGKGLVSGSFLACLDSTDGVHQLFAVWTYGNVEIQFVRFLLKPPFNSLERRTEILDRLNQIEGVKIPTDGINRRPSLSLEVLSKGDRLEQFLKIFDWMIEEINKVN